MQKIFFRKLVQAAGFVVSAALLLNTAVMPGAAIADAGQPAGSIIVSFGGNSDPDIMMLIGASGVPDGTYTAIWNTSGGGLTLTAGNVKVIKGNCAPVQFKDSAGVDSIAAVDGAAGILTLTDQAGNVVDSETVTAGISDAQKARLDAAASGYLMPVTGVAFDIFPDNGNYTNYRHDNNVLIMGVSWALTQDVPWDGLDPGGTALVLKGYTDSGKTTPLNFPAVPENRYILTYRSGSGFNDWVLLDAKDWNGLLYAGLTADGAVTTGSAVLLGDALTTKTAYVLNADGTWYKLSWQVADAMPPLGETTGTGISVKAEYPSGSTFWDEKSINPITINGTTRYFLKVTFADPEGDMRLTNLGALKISEVLNKNVSSPNLLDADFIVDQNAGYLYGRDNNLKEFYLLVPVKLLKPGTTYTVDLSAGIVTAEIAGHTYQNDAIHWEFTTMPVPTAQGIFPATVGEDYDADQPVIIRDENLGEAPSVYFNGTRADSVKKRQDSSGPYLEVYLPSGHHRLDPGTYSVKVANDANHTVTLSEPFNVIPRGGHFPDSTYKKDDSAKEGDVLKDLKVSQDTMELAGRYRGSSHLKLDLDQLMGEDVRTRQITFTGSRGDEIGTLETVSKWADITIYGLTLSDGYTDKEISLSLGRAEPAVVQALQKSLQGKAVKSDFIQVAGENFSFTRVDLSVPLKNSSGSKLQVLRYDLNSRRWYPQNDFQINRVDRTAEIHGTSPGIFVVIEGGGQR